VASLTRCASPPLSSVAGWPSRRYPLSGDLWYSKWLIAMQDNECEPMFITFLVILGVFLLLAVRSLSEYRLVIAFAAWHDLAHSATMLIQSIETSVHGVPRGYNDVILFAVIGIALLLSVPPKEATSVV
jgi:hypothetical protein